MNIDAMSFRSIARTILPPRTALTPTEATAIIQLGYLAIGIDLDEYPEEHALLSQLGRHVSALAGIAFDEVPRPSPLPLDDEERAVWIERLADELTSPGARELGYVTAYLLAVSDLAVDPIEPVFLDELQHQLGIPDERAAELVAQAGEQLTFRE